MPLRVDRAGAGNTGAPTCGRSTDYKLRSRITGKGPRCDDPARSMRGVLERVEKAIVLAGFVEERVGPDKLAFPTVFGARIVREHVDLRRRARRRLTNLTNHFDAVALTQPDVGHDDVRL